MSVRARVSRRWQGDVELIKILNMCNDEPDLGAPNELQNTPAYLAILFDRPEARRLGERSDHCRQLMVLRAVEHLQQRRQR